MNLLMKSGLAATVALVAMPASAAVTNLLTNGSFESGLAGWTLTNNELPGTGASAPVVIDYNQSSNYPTGAYGEIIPTPTSKTVSPDAAGKSGLYFSSDTSRAPGNGQMLSQAVKIAANTTYRFGFDYYLPLNGLANPNGAYFTAALNGVTFASFAIDATAGAVWTNIGRDSGDLPDGEGTLSFTFTSDGFPAEDIVIDRVYLIDSSTIPGSVPEPATWGMMVLGFGMAGAALRSRRRAAVAA